MRTIIINGKRVLILNKNEKPPNFKLDNHNDISVCIEAKGKNWLFVYHQENWLLVSKKPFTTLRKAVEIATIFDFASLYEIYN